MHDVERPARVVRRDHRLRSQERLVRPHAEVLVDRRVVDGATARVQLGQLSPLDPALEAHAAVQPVLARETLEPLAVGPVADDHDLERRVERGRLEQQVDPLRAVEPAHREHEAVERLAAVVELLRRGAASPPP